jgi:hypothetical protein
MSNILRRAEITLTPTLPDYRERESEAVCDTWSRDLRHRLQERDVGV